MTIEQNHISPNPVSLIPARVNIHHLQLRDLLQHTGVKDKVLFVSRLQVEQADFSAPYKPPSTYCTLDFQPNCLTTGCELLAAGGQHGELALRPLSSETGERPRAPWLLRTPTGGSINNAITIQSDLNHPSSSSPSSTGPLSGSSAQSAGKAAVTDTYEGVSSYSPWARDEPSNVARPGLLFGDEEMESELSQSVFEELAAAYGFDPSSVNRSSHWRRSPHTRAAIPPPTAAVDPALVAPIKVMVSNNDQSIKLYKLRPPSSSLKSSSPTRLSQHPIETNLPGLSRNTTLHFSTAINHSSLSPSQRTLIAVGDTPEVFIHTISPSGEHTHIATYTASSDACFSTTWSPDGSKFAVASQDGVVSVWDVRSSKRLASVGTTQGGGGGSGAARVCKWSPCGRYLAFSEHRNYWGVSDTITFSEVQKIAAPTLGDRGSASVGAGAGGAGVAENWVERRLAGEDRFRMVTGGEEAIARDRERRSMIHATFMREWNRAINLVDHRSSDLSSTSNTSPLDSANNTSTSASATTGSRTTGGNGNVGVGSRGSNYFPAEFPSLSPNPLVTTSTTSSRREDLLAAALSTSASGYRPSSYSSIGSGSSEGSSINISGLCWDPEGEHIYVSTERVVAKYDVQDVRLSVAKADLL